MHKWVDLSESGYGVSVLNDCKYGFSVHENNIDITLMRAPICPDPTGDIGYNEFTYSLVPLSALGRRRGYPSLPMRLTTRPRLFIPLSVRMTANGLSPLREKALFSMRLKKRRMMTDTFCAYLRHIPQEENAK